MRQGVLIAAALTASLQASSWLFAASAQVIASRDNTLFESATGALSNGSGQYLFIGLTGPNDGPNLRRALVKFDLSAIPDDAIVTSVTVSYAINKAPSVENDGQPSPGTAYLHLLETDWGEGASNAPGPEGGGTTAAADDATWLHTFHDTDSWAAAGGDFVAVASASAPFGVNDTESLVFTSNGQLVADVQAWIDSPASNHGWILIGDESNARNSRRMASREHASQNPPTLDVQYTVPDVTDQLVLTEIASGLQNPIDVVNAGDGTGRLFIVEQGGRIRIYDPGTDTLQATPFLDISSLVFSSEDPQGGFEQGLLGLAFHPDYGYGSEGRFYVNYTTNPSSDTWHTVVSEYQVSGDPDIALTTASVVLEFEQESKNHNGGAMAFGPDGYLYISSGDGGGSGDIHGNAQNVDTIKGALLRIDVDSTAPTGSELCGIANNHGIPSGNAFPGSDDGCDEILHLGLRNPWQFGFDAESGELWIGDVGQGDWEEVNRVAGNASGVNFGWPCLEGTHVYDSEEVCPGELTGPVIEYAQSDGNCSVTGGYVYRGSRLPIRGHYVYGDWCSDRIWVAEKQDETWISVEWTAAAAALSSISGFGQGESCEIYVVDRTGAKVYRIDDGEQLILAGFESLECR
jgi:glucose/arabinose dehydrogenase